jgi:hypothetical protein
LKKLFSKKTKQKKPKKNERNKNTGVIITRFIIKKEERNKKKNHLQAYIVLNEIKHKINIAI